MYEVYIKPYTTPSGTYATLQEAEERRARLIVDALSENPWTLNPDKYIIILKQGDKLPDDWHHQLLDYEDFSEVYNEE